jgi:hypothetical protein
MFLIGRWDIAGDSLHWKDDKSAFIRAMNHESPLLKFPAGPVMQGDAVRVDVHWDACEARGLGSHRALAKLVLRVKPISDLRNDAQIRIVQTCNDVETDEGKRLRPIYLNVSNVRLAESERFYMISVTPETEELARSLTDNAPIIEEMVEYAHYAEILPPIPPWGAHANGE